MKKQEIEKEIEEIKHEIEIHKHPSTKDVYKEKLDLLEAELKGFSEGSLSKEKEVLSRIKIRIEKCIKDLRYARNIKNPYADNFRLRLDELLLLWCEFTNILYMDACKKFKINYTEVDTPKERIKSK